jgi:hypothetical protein
MNGADCWLPLITYLNDSLAPRFLAAMIPEAFDRLRQG